MKNFIFPKAIAQVGLALKKYSPEILTGVGVTGVIGGTILACKATTKASDIFDEKKEMLHKVDVVFEEHSKTDPKEDKNHYTEENKSNDIRIINTQTVLKLVKLYGPAALTLIGSILCFVSATTVLKKRNAAIAAAYTAVDASFRKYRDRVIDKFGDDIDKELRFNMHKEEMEIEDENGKKVKKTVNIVDGTPEPGEYSKFFDSSCNGWMKSPESNLFFLRSQQECFNEILKNRGYVFLNEIYDALGIEKTRAGQMVGWMRDSGNKDSDGYIDFGIYNGESDACRKFVNGLETVILLDFNCDGSIMSYFTDHDK